MGFSADDQFEIFRLVASFLHLGNVDYEETEINNMQASEITDTAPLEAACRLMMLDFDEVAEAMIIATQVREDWERRLMTQRLHEVLGSSADAGRC